MIRDLGRKVPKQKPRFVPISPEGESWKSKAGLRETITGKESLSQITPPPLRREAGSIDPVWLTMSQSSGGKKDGPSTQGKTDINSYKKRSDFSAKKGKRESKKRGQLKSHLPSEAQDTNFTAVTGEGGKKRPLGNLLPSKKKENFLNVKKMPFTSEHQGRVKKHLSRKGGGGRTRQGPHCVWERSSAKKEPFLCTPSRGETLELDAQKNSPMAEKDSGLGRPGIASGKTIGYVKEKMTFGKRGKVKEEI